MKAVRFIAIFSFLLVFNFASASVIRSQNDKDAKETIKPAETVQVIPVKQKEERYRIGMYDVLEVTVYKHAELSQGSVKMDDYGRIRLPKIAAPIVAICKTENELASEITEIYKKDYLVNPYVTVVVREQNSQPIAVIGAVKKPGSFYTNRKLTLLEILSFAGGPDSEFAGNKVLVARVGSISGCVDNNNAQNKENEIKFFSYKLADVQKGKTNPFLESGDIVSVLDADIIYVYGNVNKEGQIRVKEPITLLQAIVSAEGLKPSSKNKVRILRQKEGSDEREELVFDLKEISQRKIQDPYLQPNDVVAVSEDPTKSILRAIGKSLTNGIPSLLYKAQIP